MCVINFFSYRTFKLIFFFRIAETDSQISKRISEWDKFLESDEATKPKKEEKAAETSKEDNKPKSE